MTNEKKQEYTLRISSANKTELVEILYEMLIDYVNEAKEATEKNDVQKVKDAIRKARGCTSELMESVNTDNELAPKLMSLYKYVVRELVCGEIRQDKECFENIQRVIEPLKNAYLEIMKKDVSGAVMTNTQTVVFGLTYSKNDINEALDENAKRGFYV